MAWTSRKLLAGAGRVQTTVLMAAGIAALFRGPQLSISHLFISAVVPVIKVLMMVSVGYFLAHPSVNVLTKEIRQGLARITFFVFLPSILFVKLGAAISLSNFIHWWFIPVNVVVAAAVGYVIGVFVAWVCDTPHELRRITHVMVAVGNMGNLPLVLVAAVCSDPNNPFGTTCGLNGIAYTALGMWMANVVMWSFVYNYIVPPELLESLTDYRAAPQVEGEESLNVITPGVKGLAVTPLLLSSGGAEQNGGPLLDSSAIIATSSANDSEVQPVLNSYGVFTPVLAFLDWICKVLMLYHIFKPPVLAATLGIVVGLMAPVRHILFHNDGSLRFISDVLAMFGGAMIPSILLVLGGNLSKGPGSSKMNIASTVGIVFTRLIITPITGMGIVLLADKLGWLPPDDKMFRFICLLQHTMPSAVQINSIATLLKFGEEEVSALLLYQYNFSMFTVTLFMVLYILILFG